VAVYGQRQPNGRVRIFFPPTWVVQVRDTYDWEIDRGGGLLGRVGGVITEAAADTRWDNLPNPDYGWRDPDAVSPNERSVRVNHRIPRRVEAAGLAAPFQVRTREWPVLDAPLLSAAEVDPSRSLR
jgi:hypothetical protein